jgi:hypothetical protein
MSKPTLFIRDAAIQDPQVIKLLFKFPGLEIIIGSDEVLTKESLTKIRQRYSDSNKYINSFRWRGVLNTKADFVVFEQIRYADAKAIVAEPHQKIYVIATGLQEPIFEDPFYVCSFSTIHEHIRAKLNIPEKKKPEKKSKPQVTYSEPKEHNWDEPSKPDPEPEGGYQYEPPEEERPF